jgi:hypothetical protein
MIFQTMGIPDFYFLGTTETDYLKSLVCCEIDWLSKYAGGKGELFNPFIHASSNQQSPQAHIDLLEKFLSIIPLITPKAEEIISAWLWHPDFHAGNIFVDEDGKITSLIDWQGRWTGPIFINVNPPKLEVC